MKILICIFLILSFSAMYGQTSHANSSIIKSSTNIEYFSSAVSNAFIHKMLFGGEITNALISQNTSKSDKINTLGGQFNSNLSYRLTPSDTLKKYGIQVSIGEQLFGSTNYHDSLFGLIFNGNKPYLGSSIPLSNTSFNYISRSKFGIGFVSKKNNNRLLLSISAIKNYSSILINRGSIYVPSNTSYIQLDIKGNTIFQDKSSTTVGIGLDFEINLKTKQKETNTYNYRISSENIGIGILNKGITNYWTDTTYIFSGLTINQIKNSKELIQKNRNQFDSLGIYSNTEKKYILLPGTIQFEKINENITLKKMKNYYGVILYPSISIIPLFYFGFEYWINTNFKIGINQNYGVVNQLRTGLELSYSKNKFKTSLTTQNLFGNLINSFSGKSLSIQLQCEF